MIDKSYFLKNQGSLYLEFILKDGLFHKMLLLLHMGFQLKLVDVTLSYYVILPIFRIFYLEMRPTPRIFLKKSQQ